MLINAIYTTVGHMEYSCVLNYLFKCNLCFRNQSKNVATGWRFSAFETIINLNFRNYGKAKRHN